MCGIVGIAGYPGRDAERRAAVFRMARVLGHRGPDGEGDADRDGCTLGFRRLAIVDVGGATAPYPNETETVWSICNGEIYNSDTLRAELIDRGHRFRTRVDTEVISHLYEEFGSELVERLNGMFALAVWDEPRRLLLLARDRAGEKPVFYRVHRGELAFASELRAFVEQADGPLAVDPVALSRYLLHDYFPAPLTPLAGVRKLPAGHVLTWRGGEAAVRQYWDLAGHFGRTLVKSEREVAGELDALIGQAVRRRSKSDVPVGVFLSGGLDSSTILAHLSEQEGKGVPVFALGHRDPAFDESRHARRIAEHLGAEFHELILDEEDLEEGLRRIAAGFDEPLGDASIIPTHLLALFARRRVKVVLSGEGGDELFGGYPTYAADRYAEIYRGIPGPLRRGALGGLRALLPVRMGNNGLDYLLSRFAQGAERERIERHHCWFGSLAPERQVRLLSPALRAALEADDPFASAREAVAGKRLPDGLSELLYTDFTMYLADDLLVKVDRATMLASLEARAPFLDHELAEYVAGLPSRFKVRGSTGKWILREAVRHRLPSEVLSRRKRGFTIPFSRWLLHGLRDRMRARFSPERVRARGLFDPAGVSTLLEEHLARRVDHKKALFTMLSLDLWCDRVFGDGAPVPLAGAATPTALPAGDAAAPRRATGGLV
jgi:asparagine synthase (glutamine-hydrolysing)